MAGLFTVTDIPARRVVQYKRDIGGSVYVEDESKLGEALDDAPYADKTGLVATSGSLFEVPYLPDAGAVYISTQPGDAEPGSTLKAAAKAGKGPYTWQWFKDNKQVVNVPDSGSSLKAADVGEYFAVATDADGVQAYTKIAKVAPKDVAESDSNK